MCYSLWYNAVPHDVAGLKFKPRERAFKQFKSPVLNVLIHHGHYMKFQF